MSRFKVRHYAIDIPNALCTGFFDSLGNCLVHLAVRKWTWQILPDYVDFGLFLFREIKPTGFFKIRNALLALLYHLDEDCANLFVAQAIGIVSLRRSEVPVFYCGANQAQCCNTMRIF